MINNIKIDDIRLKILASRSTTIPFVIKKAFNNIPPWEYFLDHLDYSSNTPYKLKRQVGDSYFILQTFVGGKKLRDGYSEMFRFLNKAHPSGTQSFPYILISLLGNVENYEEHSDPYDQMHIACIGESFWNIKLSDETIVNYILGPGDLLFIPAGILHKTESNTPRSAIVFSSNK